VHPLTDPPPKGKTRDEEGKWVDRKRGGISSSRDSLSDMSRGKLSPTQYFQVKTERKREKNENAGGGPRSNCLPLFESTGKLIKDTTIQKGITEDSEARGNQSSWFREATPLGKTERFSANG